MIKHIVAIQVLPDIDDAAMRSILSDIEGLVGQIPGMRSVTFGRTDSPERLERGFTHALMVDFDDRTALESYGANQEHRRIGERIVAATRGGVDGLLVLDIDVGMAVPNTG